MFDSAKLMYATGGGAGFYETEISQSLRFNDNDSAYLSWTPASAGNRKTWTWSGWVKRGNGTRGGLFGSNTSSGGVGFGFGDVGGTNWEMIYFTAYGVGTQTTSAFFRDFSAWYHIVLAFDTTQATASNRVRLYVNGTEVTFGSSVISQNTDYHVNGTFAHHLGNLQNDALFDGYLAEVNFIDGTALDADDFGEFKSGVWIPKEYSGSYGTNGFYLPFNHDYSVEGFSATTYTGNGSSSNRYIGGVGFSPDLVWIKNRGAAHQHNLIDTVRGNNVRLRSDDSLAEETITGFFDFENDGFRLTTNNASFNQSGYGFVAWCWDAGSGSAVSNTDGSITSSVKASTDYGFSIVSYTGNGTDGATIGHGLSQTPEMVIVKNRDNANTWWAVAHTGLTTGYVLGLNDTSAELDHTGLTRGIINNLGSTTFAAKAGTVSNETANGNGEDHIAYCFHSVSGYSKFGSYTGTGASGNSVTTGFKPAFVMVKCSSEAENWTIFDNVRDTANPNDKGLYANSSGAEATISTNSIDITDTGFELNGTGTRTNGSSKTYIYMAFADKREAAFWLDQSGNNNDFENNNLTESDISLDSPTNNFATLNPLHLEGTLANGNLQHTGSSAWTDAMGTIGVSSGKWYWEITPTSGATDGVVIGIKKTSSPIGWASSNAWAYYNEGNTGSVGSIYGNGINAVSYGTPYTNNDVIGVALDLDAGTLVFYKNGTSQGTAFSTGLTGVTVAPLLAQSTGVAIANFGQDSSFAGNKTAQGNTDNNGIGDFYYAPPSGYLALCTANLPDPVASIDPAQDGSPQDHFNTVTYDGSSSDLSVTGVGFQPDFCWIKRRSGAAEHELVDAVRGASKLLSSDTTGAELDRTYFKSFDADGFSVETGVSNFNNPGETYVGWNWKANGSGVSNTDGSITSTVSANTDAGFAIVDYNGGGNGSTMGHGLGAVPACIFVKKRDSDSPGNARSWAVYHKALASDKVLQLNSTAAQITEPNWFREDLMSTSVFGVNNDYNTGYSGDDYIAYVWAEVDGFSKFGSYRGTNVAEGSFVYTGFRPAFVLIKNTGQAFPWIMLDATRNAYNLADDYLQANDSAAEVSDSSRAVDFLSNGFKVRGDSSYTNSSSYDMIYMAFAENPFKYANAR